MNKPRSRQAPYLLVALACTVATACSQGEQGVIAGPSGEPVISLSESACYGTCPVYDMTLKPDGAYTLNGVKYVRTVGLSEGKLPQEAWSEAETVLRDAGFWKMRPKQTADTLPNCMQEAPTTLVTWRTLEGKEKTLTYYAGCTAPETRQMVADLRAALRFDDLVWTEERFPNPFADDPR